ncbi:MAG: hypothetical protein GY931_06220 [Maribacter sp.]|nr:hypothetical protein [Maribacter sp.]
MSIQNERVTGGWKCKLIKLIANGDPVLMNWVINPHEDGRCAVYFPPKTEKLTMKQASEIAVLVPTKNIKNLERKSAECDILHF